MVDSVSDDDTDEDADNAGNYRENRMLVPRSFCYDALVCNFQDETVIDRSAFVHASFETFGASSAIPAWAESKRFFTVGKQ